MAHLRGRGQLFDQYVASVRIAVEDDVDGVAPFALIHPHHASVRQYSSIAEDEIVDNLTDRQGREGREYEATDHETRQCGSWPMAVTDERKNNALQTGPLRIVVIIPLHAATVVSHSRTKRSDLQPRSRR